MDSKSKTWWIRFKFLFSVCEKIRVIYYINIFCSYNEELALILLHWHDYDIKKAIDDIPNYVPTANKWKKNEIRKFLKCIDSKPRKNFVEAKKTVII